MLEKFMEMYTLQNRLNDHTNGKGWVEGVTNKGRVINWFRCIYMEAAEAIDSINWKHWKDIEKKDDVDNIKIELVDIWHFIMSEHIKSLGVEDGAKKAFTLSEEDDSHKDEKLIDILELMIAKSSHGMLPLEEFFSAIEKIEDFNANDVYLLYIGKNCLNQFRQDNGYKEGTYQKVWSGKEDNVYMQQILKENQDITFDALYKELGEKYRELN